MDAFDYFICITLIALGFCGILKLIGREGKRRDLALKNIDAYVFPNSISRSISKKYPHLTREEIDSVLSGLKQFFYACCICKGKSVGMPSRSVDYAWHKFILHTKEYKKFCKNNIGWFVHHTPAGSSGEKTVESEGTKRIWITCCLTENIDQRKPKSLPLLFSLASVLNIQDGLIFILDSHPGNGIVPGVDCISDYSTDSSSFSSCSSCSGGGD